MGGGASGPRSPRGAALVAGAAVAARLAAVVELQDVVLALASCRGRLGAEDELDAIAAQDLAERLEGGVPAEVGVAVVKAIDRRLAEIEDDDG